MSFLTIVIMTTYSCEGIARNFTRFLPSIIIINEFFSFLGSPELILGTVPGLSRRKAHI